MPELERQFEPAPEHWREHDTSDDNDKYVICGYCGARVPYGSTQEGHLEDCPVAKGSVTFAERGDKTEHNVENVLKNQQEDPKEALLRKAQEMRVQKEREITEAKRELLFQEIGEDSAIFIEDHPWGRNGMHDVLERKGLPPHLYAGENHIFLNFNKGAQKTFRSDSYNKNLFNPFQPGLLKPVDQAIDRRLAGREANEQIEGFPLFRSTSQEKVVSPEKTVGWGPFKKKIPSEKRIDRQVTRIKMGEIMHGAKSPEKEAYRIDLSVMVQPVGEDGRAFRPPEIMKMSMIMDRDLYDKVKKEIEREPNFIGPLLKSLFPEILESNLIVNDSRGVRVALFDETDLEHPDVEKVKLKEY